MEEIVHINGQSVQVDIAEELSEYQFDNERWTADKLIASSPFRDDMAPSFFVSLTGEYAGVWGDSGAYDEEYSSGNFVSLIAKLRRISYEEASEYLLEKYGVLHAIKEDEPIRIKRPQIKSIFKTVIIDESPIIEAVSPYLISRGIDEQVQQDVGLGYDKDHRGYTAIPWKTEGGKIANIFYRSTRGKRFFYRANSTPKNRLLFGNERTEETAVLTEGVIDAMSFDVAGISGISVGGARLSDFQAELIKRSGIKTLYLGGDNDEQGRALNEQAKRKLRGYVELYEINYGKEKDANDVLLRHGAAELRSIVERAKPIHAIRVRT